MTIAAAWLEHEQRLIDDMARRGLIVDGTAASVGGDGWSFSIERELVYVKPIGRVIIRDEVTPKMQHVSDAFGLMTDSWLRKSGQ